MATDFTVTIKSSGGSYTTVSAAEAALDSDLTASSSQVFTISEASEAIIDDASAVTGDSSGATGTLLHHTTTQAYIIGVGGTPFDNGETVSQDGSGNDIVLDSAQDQVDNVVFECHAQDLNDNLDAGGWTTGTTAGTNGLVITVPEGQRHNGTDHDKSGQGFKIYTSTAILFNVNRAGMLSFKCEWVNGEATDQAICQNIPINGSYTFQNCVFSRLGTAAAVAFSINQGGSSAIFENMILVVADYRAMDTRGGATSVTISHCTLAGENSNATYGILTDGDTVDTIKNTSVSDFVTREYFACDFSGATHRTNATTDATWEATDSDSNDSTLIVADDEFVSDTVVMSTADYHLKAGSNLETIGTAGVSTIDIDNDSRDGSNPDIGADEFVAVADGGRLLLINPPGLDGGFGIGLSL